MRLCAVIALLREIVAVPVGILSVIHGGARIIRQNSLKTTCAISYPFIGKEQKEKRSRDLLVWPNQR
jgi:hypothetical protein